MMKTNYEFRYEIENGTLIMYSLKNSVSNMKYIRLLSEILLNNRHTKEELIKLEEGTLKRFKMLIDAGQTVSKIAPPPDSDWFILTKASLSEKIKLTFSKENHMRIAKIYNLTEEEIFELKLMGFLSAKGDN